MALDVQGITTALESHAAALGCFDRVNTFEPKAAPMDGMTCAIWVQAMSPASSGLASTSFRLEFWVRLMMPMLTEPQESIDPALMTAADQLLADYIGNFTLSGLLRCVDVRGSEGAPLSVLAGYIEQDKRVLRVLTISLPLIVNDLYTEGP